MTIYAFIQGIGPLELALVLGVVLLIFGPKRLPGLGRSVGTGFRELKASLAGKDEADEAGSEDDPDAARKSAALGGPSEPVAPGAAPVAEADRVPERR